MNLKVFQFILIVFLSYLYSVDAAACKNDRDCNSGTCKNKAYCVCDAGFSGRTCGEACVTTSSVVSCDASCPASLPARECPRTQHNRGGFGCRCERYWLGTQCDIQASYYENTDSAPFSTTPRDGFVFGGKKYFRVAWHVDTANEHMYFQMEGGMNGYISWIYSCASGNDCMSATREAWVFSVDGGAVYHQDGYTRGSQATATDDVDDLINLHGYEEAVTTTVSSPENSTIVNFERALVASEEGSGRDGTFQNQEEWTGYANDYDKYYGVSMSKHSVSEVWPDRIIITHGSPALTPPKAPANLAKYVVCKNYIAVTWNEPGSYFDGTSFNVNDGYRAWGGYFIKAYIVELFELKIDSYVYSSHQVLEMESLSFSNPQALYSCFTNLQQTTTYRISVKAVTTEGINGTAAIVEYTTPDGSTNPPAATEILTAYSLVNQTYVFLKWYAPELNGGVLLGYELQVLEIGVDQSFNTIPEITSTSGYTCQEYQHNNLKPETEYQYRVRTITSGGNGPFGTPQTFITPAYPPCDPAGNECNGNGNCVKSKCVCNIGYVGDLCDRQTVFTQTVGDVHKIYWDYDNSGVTDRNLYVQLDFVTNGSVSLMYNYQNGHGMSKADCWAFHVDASESDGSVTPWYRDMWGTEYITDVTVGDPIDPTDDIQEDLAEVHGYHYEGVDGTHTVIYFRRRLDTGDTTQDYPIVSGFVNSSWAITFTDQFEQHGVTEQDRNVFQIDWLSPKGAPSAPQNVVISAQTQDSVTIVWQTPLYSGSSPITGYSVQFRISGNQYTEVTTVDASTFQYTFAELSPGQTYDFGVIAINSLGQSPITSVTTSTLDNDPPKVDNCPSTITGYTTSTTDGANIFWDAITATDSQDGLITEPSTIACTPGPCIANGGYFKVNDYTYTYTFTDSGQNSVDCVFSIVVYDDDPPLCSDDVDCSCPLSTVLEATSSDGAQYFMNYPIAIDNIHGPVSAIPQYDPIEMTPVNANTYMLGTTTVSFLYRDSNNPPNEVVNCSVAVTVQDTTDPTYADCPSNKVFSTGPTGTGVAVSWIDPTFSDTVDTSVTVVTSSLPIGYETSGQNFPVSTNDYIITFTGTDDSGNSASCSFSITIKDGGSPYLNAGNNCPTSQNVFTDIDQPGKIVNYEIPTVIDDVDTSLSFSLSGFSTGSLFPISINNEPWPVVLTWIDDANNEFSCSFSYTVTDNVKPIINGCPANNLIFLADEDLNGAKVWIPTLKPTDNSLEPTVNGFLNNFVNGSVLPIGTHTVVYRATDPYSNVQSCSMTVEVRDTVPPVATCPSTQTGTTSSPVVNYVNPTANDNLDGALTFYDYISYPKDNNANSYSSGSSFPYGTTTITYKFKDQSSNEASCNVTVIITDDQAPGYTTIGACAQPNLNYDTDNNIAFPGGVQILWTEPQVTDAINGVITPIITSTPSGFRNNDIFRKGTTRVNYIWKDDAGNSLECTIVITVTDIHAPVLTYITPNYYHVADSTLGSAGKFAADFSEPTAFDNVDGSSLSITIDSGTNPILKLGDLYPAGITTMSYTFSDTSDNSISHTFTVTIDDVTAPVITFCPSSTNYYIASTSNTATVTWTEPAAEDNVNGPLTVPTPTISPATNAGDQYLKGTYTINYLFKDTKQNETPCEFQITVIDNTAPQVTFCDTSKSTGTTVEDTGLISWTQPVANDNTDENNVIITVTSTRPTITLTTSGTYFPFGNTIIMYTIKDQSGNEAYCNINVDIIDTTKPYISPQKPCPTIVQNVTNNMNGAYLHWIEPEALDYVDSSLVVEKTIDIQGAPVVSGGFYPKGDYILNYKFIDDANNFVSCNVQLKVIDNHPPTFTNCPSNQSLSANATIGSNGLLRVFWITPTATDNVDLNPTVTLLTSKNSGSKFAVGTHVVKYEAADLSNLKSTCQFYVIIRDITKPVITYCTPSYTTNVKSTSSLTANQLWLIPQAIDNVQLLPSPTITSIPAGYSRNSEFPIGKTWINYQFNDTSGNTNNCTFFINVIDVTPPVLSCPSAITRKESSPTAVWSVTVTDNVDTNVAYLFSSNPSGFSSGMPFPKGQVSFVYNATDNAGNFANCTFTVTVTNVSGPIIDGCPSSQVVGANTTHPGNTVTWIPPTAVNETNNILTTTPETSPTKNLDTGLFFPYGDTKVRYSFVDNLNKRTNCTFVITIIDITPPVKENCPSSFTQYVDANIKNPAGAVVTWSSVTFKDNVTPNPIVQQTSGQAKNSIFTVGVYSVAYSGTDSVGLSDECTFSITIVDNIAPVITCSADINGDSDSTGLGVTLTVPEATATDNHDTSVTIESSLESLTTTFSIGTTVVTFTATDTASNSASCSLNVIVVDKTPPIVSDCPPILQTSYEATSASGVDVIYTAPSAIDAYSTVSENIAYTPNSPVGNTFPLGTTTITYTFNDEDNNSANCQFTITVEDTTKPSVSTCPSTQNLDANDALPYPGGVQFNFPTIVVTDVVDSNLDSVITTSPTSLLQSGDIFPIGTTTVSVTYTDDYGNFETCSFVVVISDVTAPTVFNCPTSMTNVTSYPLQTGIYQTWNEPYATDSSINGLITASPTSVPIISNVGSGSFFGINTYTISYVFSDGKQSSECIFTLTVTDQAPPYFITPCPNNISTTTDTGKATAKATITAPEATDSISSVTTTVTRTPTITAGNYKIGTTVVHYKFVDESSNILECIFGVTVSDNEKPSITCPNSIIINAPGTNGTIVTWNNPVATDNEDPSPTIQLLTAIASGELFPIGISTIIYQAIDRYNNFDNCNFTVEVRDVSAPIVYNCPVSFTVGTDASIPYPGGANVSWTVPSAIDSVVGNMSTPTPITTPSNLDVYHIFPVSTSQILYEFRDNNNNLGICSFSVTVVDTISPVITSCPNNIVVPTDPQIPSGGAYITWNEPTAFDNVVGNVTNSAQILISTSPDADKRSGDIFPVGTTTIRYVFEDLANPTRNPSLPCIFNVTVVDTSPPVWIACQQNHRIIKYHPAPVAWDVPTAYDYVDQADTTVTRFTTPYLNDSLPFPLGRTNFTYRTQDLAGNVVFCNFSIEYIDNTPPIITFCPVSVNIRTGIQPCAKIYMENYTATAEDAVDGVIKPYYTELLNQPFNFTNNNELCVDDGDLKIVYHFTDNSSNTVQCDFNISITQDDLIPPTIVGCPPNITGVKYLDENGEYKLNIESFTVTDNVDAGLGVFCTSSPRPYSFTSTVVEPSTVAFHCEASDTSGNQASCDFSIEIADIIKPTLTTPCPSNQVSLLPIYEEVSPTVQHIFTWIEPEAMDNVDGAISFTRYGAPPGSKFFTGIHQIRYEWTDTSNNTETCSFSLTFGYPDCPNNCNGDVCVRGGCQCQMGHLGKDCSIRNAVKRETDNVILYHSHDQEYVYVQVIGKTTGWVGIIVNYDPSQHGMALGDCWALWVDSNNIPHAEDRFSPNLNTPTLDSQQDLLDIQGHQDNNLVYVSFKRKLDTNDPDNDYIFTHIPRTIINSSDDVPIVPTSWAYLQNIDRFVQHGESPNERNNWPDFQWMIPLGEPIAPQPPEFDVADTNWFKISWKEPDFVGSDVIHNYTVQYRKIGDNTWITAFEGLALSATVTSLPIGTEFDVRVRATNKFGSGPYSDPGLAVTFFTAPIVPSIPLPPSRLDASPSSLIVTWPKVTDNQLNGIQFKQYEVQISSKIKPNEWSSYLIPNSINPSQTESQRRSLTQHEITGLTRKSTYLVRLRLISFAGASNFSSIAPMNTTDFDDCTPVDNPCNNQGKCIQAKCMCELQYHGDECELEGKAVFPIAGGAHALAFVADENTGYLYFNLRFTAPSDTYVGIIIDAPDGMTNGDCWEFRIEQNDGLWSVYTRDRWSINLIDPPPLDANEVNDIEDAKGYITDTGLIHVQFKRAFKTQDTVNDVDIRLFEEMDVSYARGKGGPSWIAHGTSTTDRGKLKVDFSKGSLRELTPPSWGQFYPWIIILGSCALFSMLLLFIPGFRRSELGLLLLNKKIAKLPKRTFLDDLTLDIRLAGSDLFVGELFLCGAYLASLIIYSLRAEQIYLKAQRDPSYVSGQLAAVHMCLVMFPIARTSIWTKIFGISFERAIKYHRWLGRIAFIYLTAHFFTMLDLWGWVVIMSDTPTPSGPYGNLYGTLAYFLVIIMLFFAMWRVRRTAFELFYVVHHLYIPIIIFSAMHSYNFMYMMIIPVGLYVIDRFFRFYYSNFTKVEVVEAKILPLQDAQKGAEVKVSGDKRVMTRLTLRIKGFHFGPGDFIFIRIRNLSYFEWHPFSISSPPGRIGDPFTLHIMDMGDNTFSKGVHKLFPIDDPSKLKVDIEGPYGSLQFKVEDCRVFILCAGGVGVTPLYSTLIDVHKRFLNGDLDHLEAVHFIWVSRFPSPLTHWWAREFLAIQNTPGFHIHLYCTARRRFHATHSDGRGPRYRKHSNRYGSFKERLRKRKAAQFDPSKFSSTNMAGSRKIGLQAFQLSKENARLELASQRTLRSMTAFGSSSLSTTNKTSSSSSALSPRFNGGSTSSAYLSTPRLSTFGSNMNSKSTASRRLSTVSSYRSSSSFGPSQSFRNESSRILYGLNGEEIGDDEDDEYYEYNFDPSDTFKNAEDVAYLYPGGTKTAVLMNAVQGSHSTNRYILDSNHPRYREPELIVANNVISGRPDFAEIFEEIRKHYRANNRQIGVMICGPERMVIQCMRLATEKNFMVHRETFFF